MDNGSRRCRSKTSTSVHPGVEMDLTFLENMVSIFPAALHTHREKHFATDWWLWLLQPAMGARLPASIRNATKMWNMPLMLSNAKPTKPQKHCKMFPTIFGKCHFRKSTLVNGAASTLHTYINRIQIFLSLSTSLSAKFWWCLVARCDAPSPITTQK